MTSPAPVHLRSRLTRKASVAIAAGQLLVLVTLDVNSGWLITHVLPNDGTDRICTPDVARQEIPLYVKPAPS